MSKQTVKSKATPQKNRRPLLFRARTASWKFGITMLPVDRYTDKTFWIDGHACPRLIDGQNVLDTLEEAKQWLVDWCEAKQAEAQAEADRFTTLAAKAQAITTINVEVDPERY